MFKGESRFSDCAEVGARTLTKLTRWLWPVCAVGLILLGCRGPGPAATSMPAPSATPSPSVVSTQPPPTATVTPSVTVVRVDPTQGYQTMDGIGACTYTFPYANDLGWDWEAVKFVFDELDLAYLRLAPWLGWWETANDNEDPYTINWEGFGTVHDIVNNHDLPFAQYVHAKGIELSLGVWDFGAAAWCETCEDWLAKGTPRQIAPELYPELGESISSYLLYMRRNGVPIVLTEVQNEPDIEAGIQYPRPEALRDAGRILVEQLDHFSLTDIQLYAPDLHWPRGNVPWIEAWFDDPVLRDRTVAVSYHTWWSISQQDFEEIWEAAQRYDKPVWATEVGYHEGGNAISPETWRTAWQYARAYYRAIAWSHASRTYQWTLLGNDAAVGKDGTRYPTYYVLKHFANYIPAGARLVESVPDDGRLLTLAFARPDGAYTLIVLNTAREAMTFRVTGVEGALRTAVTTTADHYEAVTSVTDGGQVIVPAESLTSLIIE